VVKLAVFAVLMEDINKALRSKKPKTDDELREKIPAEFHDTLPFFITSASP
jgi:hypothetical protein